MIEQKEFRDNFKVSPYLLLEMTNPIKDDIINLTNNYKLNKSYIHKTDYYLINRLRIWISSYYNNIGNHRIDLFENYLCFECKIPKNHEMFITKKDLKTSYSNKKYAISWIYFLAPSEDKATFFIRINRKKMWTLEEFRDITDDKEYLYFLAERFINYNKMVKVDYFENRKIVKISKADIIKKQLKRR